MPGSPIIYVVDDEPAVRRSTQAVIRAAGFTSLEFESAEDFLERYDGHAYGCIVLDLRMGATSGLELLAELRRRNCKLPAIVVSGHGDIPVVVESIKIGASDFLPKPVRPDVLIARIRDALEKSRTQALARKQNSAILDRFASLTSRELEILKALAAGRSTKQIALDWGLSQKTVSNHRAHLLAKTDAENTADMVRMAITAGIT